MKRLILFLSIFTTTAATNAQELINVNPDPSGEAWIAGGLRQLTPADYAKIAATPKLTLTERQRGRDLPTSIDNSVLPWFRPVFNQDGGSCGQASGIGYNFTFEMDYLQGLPANTTQTQYPTHYTWNFLNGGEGGGSWYFDGWQIIAANGCPNVQTYGGTPWYGGDRRWMSGYENYLSGMSNRMLEVLTIDVSTADGLETLKQWMNDKLSGSPTGGLANFSAGVSDYFSMSYLPAGTPNAGKSVVTRWGQEVNHAMTFVGYDDEIRYDYNYDGQYTNNLDITGDGLVDMRDWEIGGVIMMNSWGPSFGENGKAYVMYRTLAQSLTDGGIWNNLLHVIRTRNDYEPQLTIKTTVKYTSRQKLRIAAGVSANTTDTKPAHVVEFPIFSNQGGNYYMQGGSAENDKSIEIGLDVTQLLSYVTPGQPARFFLRVTEQDPENASAGQITGFSVNDLNQNMEFVSQMSNVALVNNDTTYAWVDATTIFTPVEITTENLPPAHAGVAYSQQLEAAGAPAPYTWSILQEYSENPDQAEFPAITSNQMIPSDNDDGYATRTIDFPFPFYGETYQDLVLTTDGSIAFGGQFEYVRNETALRSVKVITPYGADLMIYPEYNDGMFYEGDETHATFRWKISKFDNPGFDNDFAVTLYPDGKITFHYGNGITPSNDWAAGISAGDGQNFLIASISGSTEIIPGSSFRFQSPPLPSGMSLSNTGLFSGTPSQPNGSWEITFKATSTNSLFATRTLNFSTESQLLVEPDTLVFENDPEAYEGKYFTITNTSGSEVMITSFDTEGTIFLEDGQWWWMADFWDPLPYAVAPGESIDVRVSLAMPVMMQPITSYAVDKLHFTTTTENYQVLLMFNDTINIYGNAKQYPQHENGLELSPNPATGFTNLGFVTDQTGKAEIFIYNSSGDLVKRESLSGLFAGKNTRQVDISAMKPGFYMLTLRSGLNLSVARLVIR